MVLRPLRCVIEGPSRPLAAFDLCDAEEWSEDHSGAQIPKDVPWRRGMVEGPLRCWSFDHSAASWFFNHSSASSVKLRQQTSLTGGFSEA